MTKAKATTEQASQIDEATVTTAPAGGRTANQRYGAAMARLREERSVEFLSYLQYEWEQDGLTYKPRLTAAERDEQVAAERKAKAAAKIEELKAQFDL